MNEAIPANEAETGDYTSRWSGIAATTVIRRTMHYFVWIDENGDVDWLTSEQWDKKGPLDPFAHNGIMTDAALMETTPSHGMTPEHRQHFKRLIGEAIVCSFCHDYAGARKMVAAGQDYARARSEETSRRWYLLSTAGAAIPVLLVGLCLWLYRDQAALHLGGTALWLVLCSSAGAAGALLSVIWRTGKLQVDHQAGIGLHVLEGSSRIFAGMLSGVLAGLAVQNGMILAPLAKGGLQHPTLLLAAMAAGAAERLATSIISKLSPAAPTNQLLSTTKKGKGARK